MLSYARFRAEGERLVRRSHERARRAERGEGVATWEWRHGARPHLDGNSFLVSTGNEDVCVAPPEDDATALLDLHIVFHATYRTPALYFRAAAVDGTPVSAERVLRGVHLAGRGDRSLVVAAVEQHPVLGSPFALLHPCETAAAMGLLLAQAKPQSEAGAGGDDASEHLYLASWLSLVQPLTGISPMEYY